MRVSGVDESLETLEETNTSFGNPGIEQTSKVNVSRLPRNVKLSGRAGRFPAKDNTTHGKQPKLSAVVVANSSWEEIAALDDGFDNLIQPVPLLRLPVRIIPTPESAAFRATARRLKIDYHRLSPDFGAFTVFPLFSKNHRQTKCEIGLNR